MKVYYVINLDNGKKYGYYCESVNKAIENHIYYLQQSDNTECIVEKHKNCYTITQNDNVYGIRY